MKNVIIVMVGTLITIYVCFIGLNVYTIQTHKMSLERKVARGVEHAMQEGYIAHNTQIAMAILESEIVESGEKEIDLEVKVMDMQKGILSIVVKEQLYLITGRTKEIVVEQTMLVDKAEMDVSMVKVIFMVDEEVYKEYHLVRGETCPMPKVPSTSFAGWVEYGDECQTHITDIGKVWADKTYLAKMK